MNKSIFLLILALSTSLFAIGQASVKKQLRSIKTVEQAEAFLESKKSRKNNLIVFNKEKHKSELAQSLLSFPTGFTKTNKEQFKKTHYKVIKKTKDVHYRIAYIFLDGETLGARAVSKIRNLIMHLYRKGVPFGDLAKKYSMDENDANRKGDSGWVKEGDLPIEIETEAYNLAHKFEEIYNVVTPENSGYYIIKKTHRIKPIKEVHVLRVIEKTH